ncbi:MAG: Lpp/OprI family alanine-zipper lipoprotein [Gammaproteobacteria bacterium]
MLYVKKTSAAHLPGLLAGLLLVSGVTGCASTSELGSLKEQISQANATAEAARKEAAAASSKADAATREAAAAKAMAEQAMTTANDAKATSATTESKIDRMFKKAMYK